MTKLLGTFAILLLFASAMAQQSRPSRLKTDSINKYADSVRSLPPLEVQSVRVRENSPFAKSNVSAANIALVNLAQDLPFLIQSTPSVVANSDPGTGIGYTGIRIRGTDATRINVTLNGIPYNDAESMGTFFVNLPDFSSSASSIQIQRGVGTSTNGASAFGATINLATNAYNPTAYFSSQNGGGSFNTVKNNLLFGTGLISERFTFDGRLSNIRSDGFIDRAKSDLKSFYLSSTYWGDQSSLRLNIFSGKEKTYQAWYGVPEALLSTNRTFNPAGSEKTDAAYDNQTDNYTQTHYQLFYNKNINKQLKWNTALFLTKGRGYYEEYKAGINIANYGITPNPLMNSINPDLVRRRWLANSFYGQIFSLQYEEGKSLITVGGGWNQYDGQHFGNLPYGLLSINDATLIGKIYYNNYAVKKENSAYGKWEYQLTQSLSSFLDIQFRNVQHTMNGFDANPSLVIDRKFNFLNPKLGLSYKNKYTNYYASFAVAHKEPNRDDFEAGTLQQPKQEVLYDLEAGFTTKLNQFQWGINLYYMNYKDQLVLTGKINDVGAYTRTNVPKSYRAGMEIEATWQINKQWSSNGNISFSQNKINQFTEYFDDYDNGGQVAIPHQNTAIALSPNTTAAHAIQYQPNEKLQFVFNSKYVSKQYLDNTQNESRKLNAFFVNDLNVSYKLFKKKRMSALLQLYVINIFDIKYEPNGYTYSYLWGGTTTTSNNYFPMAGRNYLVSVKIDIK